MRHGHDARRRLPPVRRDEAAGRSPVYADVAERVCHEEETIAFLAALPPAKSQPTPLGAVQYVRGSLAGREAFRATLAEQAADVRRVMLARTTRTNRACLSQPDEVVWVGLAAGCSLRIDPGRWDELG